MIFGLGLRFACRRLRDKTTTTFYFWHGVIRHSHSFITQTSRYFDDIGLLSLNRYPSSSRRAIVHEKHSSSTNMIAVELSRSWDFSGEESTRRSNLRSDWSSLALQDNQRTRFGYSFDDSKHLPRKRWDGGHCETSSEAQHLQTCQIIR